MITATTEAVCVNPIYDTEGIFIGCHNPIDINTDYLSTLYTEPKSFSVEDYILKCVLNNKPFYWLLGIGTIAWLDLVFYVQKTGKLPEDFSYLDSVSETNSTLYKSLLEKARQNKLFIDISYTPTKEDWDNNRLERLPGIGLEEIQLLQNKTIEEATDLIGLEACKFILRYKIDAVL